MTKSIPDGKIVGGNPAAIIGEVQNFEKNILKFNVRTKGYSYEEKRKILLSLDDNKFLKK